MSHLPVLSELISSDSRLFLLIGVVIALLFGAMRRDTENRLTGLVVSLIVYALCEAASNIHTNYLIEIILLLAGTAALGSLLAFLIGAAVFGIKAAHH
ncbi:MAG: hypothetical protein IJG63_09165 [Oscillospiraceae bacterium]|nr:hypothetical protein [Oscillospiraceae bacterium]